MKSFLSAYLLLIMCSQVFADRLVMPKEELIKAGYQIYKKRLNNIVGMTRSLIMPINSEDSYLENTLNWPIEFQRPSEMFIGNMHQYQTFSNPAYYHAGVDILANHEQEVFTPVSGIIEGGYYSYLDSPEGNSEKYFLPLKKAIENEADIPWGKKYFEVAVIDDFGNRFEFHHVNADTLPTDIFNKIILGGQRVTAGSLVGHVIKFGSKRKRIDMTHTHYNIINSMNHYINPFYLSHEILDNKPPVIKGIYATKKAFCYRAPELTLFEEEALSTERYIVIHTVDFMTSDVLEKAPVIVKALFDNGEVFEWNFLKKLIKSNGVRPDIRDVYLKEHCNMKVKVEMRASRSFDYYYKVPVPLNYSGSVKVSVFDQSMNSSERIIYIKSK